MLLYTCQVLRFCRNHYFRFYNKSTIIAEEDSYILSKIKFQGMFSKLSRTHSFRMNVDLNEFLQDISSFIILKLGFLEWLAALKKLKFCGHIFVLTRFRSQSSKSGANVGFFEFFWYSKIHSRTSDENYIFP